MLRPDESSTGHYFYIGGRLMSKGVGLMKATSRPLSERRQERDNVADNVAVRFRSTVDVDWLAASIYCPYHDTIHVELTRTRRRRPLSLKS
jgi:hypothetical protein